ncbi:MULTISPECIES: ImmA/IrrE family metallo-endopeptidase [Corynebacterium]|uniref:ImmA/IrrE family metallo-endopeptidase n=1 Tax=Corynebacterium TaxID=1716 RepID=UPI001CEF7C63|nr:MULTISPECIES: ImmA/IrrE family metallo-endopeptidase [Corynebacterium]
MTIDELYELADRLGVTITTHDRGPKGWYEHHTQKISLRYDLRAANLRCTLAHELGHAIRGDEATGIEHFDQRAERAADQFAARLLISPAEYAAAEALYGPHEGAIARELGVTTHLLAVWRGIHERIKA